MKLYDFDFIECYDDDDYDFDEEQKEMRSGSGHLDYPSRFTK